MSKEKEEGGRWRGTRWQMGEGKEHGNEKRFCGREGAEVCVPASSFFFWQ